MGIKRVLCIIGLCTIACGCSVLMDLTRNAAAQLEYHDTTDGILCCARNRILAKHAWNDFQADNPDFEYSKHFARGFREGFVDYLEGGSGQPPVIPPRCYWKVYYQSPHGHEDIEDWFVGYRVGTGAAQQSGYRQWLTIPTSLSELCSPLP